MLDEDKFSREDIENIVEGGVDAAYIDSITSQDVMFVHQNYDQMRLLERYFAHLVSEYSRNKQHYYSF